MKTIFSVLVLCSAFVLAGCEKKAASAGSAGNPKADSMKTAYTAIITALESGNTADVDKYVSADSKDHQQMAGYPAGAEGLKKMIGEFKVAMPDSKYTVE